MVHIKSFTAKGFDRHFILENQELLFFSFVNLETQGTWDCVTCVEEEDFEGIGTHDTESGYVHPDYEKEFERSEFQPCPGKGLYKRVERNISYLRNYR